MRGYNSVGSVLKSKRKPIKGRSPPPLPSYYLDCRTAAALAWSPSTTATVLSVVVPSYTTTIILMDDHTS